MPPPEPSDRSPDPAPRAEYVAALFVAVGWAAVVFAADGLLTVALDREPIPRGVSPYYGLLALAAAGVVVWAVLARSTLARSPVLPALLAAAAVYLLLLLSGFSGGFRLAAAQATSPFTAVASGGALIAVIAFWGGMRAWRRPRRTPPP